MTEPRYVRFGEPPAGCRSANFRTGERLAGVSAYPGEMHEERGFVIETRGLTAEGGIAGLIVAAACDLPAFFLDGEEVGRGPDGEPLVKVRRSWRVPKATDVTSLSTFAQPALALWSSGPRDGSGAKVQQWRLRDGSPYVPKAMSFGVQGSPHALLSRKKRGVDDRKKRAKAARKARKSNRGG